MLVVLDTASFTELLNFWNSRARSLLHGSIGTVVGLPREAFGHPEHVKAIARSASTRDRGETLSTATGYRIEPRERPTYRCRHPMISHGFERRIAAFALVAFANGKPRSR